MMQRDRKLDYAQAGSEMTAGHRYCVDGFDPQLVGNLPELALVKPP
jgi:hypothetical protein